MVFKCFIRFVLAQTAVTHGMEFMMALFQVAQGIISTIMDTSGLSVLTDTALPLEMVTIIEDVGFIESIPLWAITLLGSLFIWVLSLIMVLTVYSRFFQVVHGHRHRAHPHGQLRRTALQQYWRCLSQKLRRHLFGGLCDCSGLYHFLGVRLRTTRHCRRYPGGGHHRVELCGRSFI
jgi:hypothetical protein